LPGLAVVGDPPEYPSPVRSRGGRPLVEARDRR